MLLFVLRRLVMLVPTFIGISIAAFAFIRLLPGDPIQMLSGERGMSAARSAELAHLYGFDRPYVVQYLDFLWNILHGDFGVSISNRRDVFDQFLTFLPATIELSLAAMLFAIVLGVPAGIFAAVRRGTVVDHGLMTTALVGFSMPIFWWALLLIIVFSNWLHWTPVAGQIGLLYYFPKGTGFVLYDALRSGQSGAFSSALNHLILPTIVLGTIPLATIARQTRSAMLEVLGEDYIRTARSKGLSPFRVVGVHAFRNALIPVVTSIGLQLGLLMGGAILTESIFAWPGIGKWVVDAIEARDYTTVQGALVLIGVIVMVVNLLVDLTYGLINPRIRHAR